MNVLITGGTGSLGTVLARQVSVAGHSVRLFVRDAAGRTTPADYERARGDLASGEGIRQAVAGMDAVIHAASDPANADAVDVNGTRHLVQFAAESGIQHFVYVSIVGIDVIPYHYYQSKRAAELVVQSSPTPYSILRATQFHGFISGLLAPLARVPVVMPVPAGFRVQSVDVGEVANRLAECLNRGPSRTIVNFGGPEILRLEDMARTWMAVAHRVKPVLPIPLPGVVAAAFRAGRNTTPDGERGSMTWAQWLQDRANHARTAAATEGAGR
jgi:uncharacterized protein YbjT (DUF2867 family)